MAIYYMCDPLLQRSKNARGENHWAAYLQEMLSRLGVPGRAWYPGQAAEFDKGDVLLVGGDALLPEIAEELAKGVGQGLTLIGFATAGGDSLFGIHTEGITPQPEDAFTLNGYFTVGADAQTAYMNVPEKQPALPVFSPVILAQEAGAERLGDVTVDGERRAGLLRCGNAFYFAFDLPQTLWASTQGRPVTENYPGFSIGRLPSARITPLDYNTEIAYGDYYLLILQNILADLGYAMLHRLPPAEDGTVPDLMLYYAGDEDSTETKITLDAAAIMAERGLPYHVNLMPYGESMDFQLSPAQFDTLRKGGCELALHYNMAGEYEWCAFTEENFRLQYRAYLQHFGIPCVSTVGHCLAHNGWAERMRYLEGIGVRGEFERSAEYDPDDVNAFNLYGFAFGTSAPFFAYDDGAHGNRRMDFVEAPIAYYEPRIGGDYSDGVEKIDRCVDAAVYFGRMINLFTHPHYVTGKSGYDNAMTLAALDESVRYIAENGYTVQHSAPDAICQFWHGRRRSSVETDDATLYYVESACDGLVVRVPADSARLDVEISVNGKAAAPVYKTIDGRLWLMVPVLGEGGHVIEIE